MAAILLQTTLASVFTIVTFGPWSTSSTFPSQVYLVFQAAVTVIWCLSMVLLFADIFLVRRSYPELFEQVRISRTGVLFLSGIVGIVGSAVGAIVTFKTPWNPDLFSNSELAPLARADDADLRRRGGRDLRGQRDHAAARAADADDDPGGLALGRSRTSSEEADEAGLRFVRFLWCGNDGTVRAKASARNGLEGRLRSGIGLTVAMQAMNALDQLQPVPGMGPVGEVRLVPDPETFRVLPYAPRAGAVMADHVRLDGRAGRGVPALVPQADGRAPRGARRAARGRVRERVLAGHAAADGRVRPARLEPLLLDDRDDRVAGRTSTG